MAIVGYSINSYSIGGYWGLLISIILVAIELMAIDDYSIVSHWRLFY